MRKKHTSDSRRVGSRAPAAAATTFPGFPTVAVSMHWWCGVDDAVIIVPVVIAVVVVDLK